MNSERAGEFLFLPLLARPGFGKCHDLDEGFVCIYGKSMIYPLHFLAITGGKAEKQHFWLEESEEAFVLTIVRE